MNLALPFYRRSLDQPDLLAISNGKSLTYAQAANRAGRVAHWIGPGQRRVGILGSRSVEACLAVLGCCWAGATYVPISLQLPPERLLTMLELSLLDALIVDSRGAAMLSEAVLAAAPGRILVPACEPLPGQGVSQFEELPEGGQEPTRLDPDQIAYIIFTSGTTGVPKGVMVSVGSVDHFVSMMQERYQLGPSDRVSENTELSFDVSVSNMFVTWNSGASLHIVPHTQAMAPAKFIQTHELTVWSSVPSVISFMRTVRMLPAGAFPSLRYSLFAGEPLALSAALAWQAAAPNSLVDNLYGPTEATIVCLGQRLTDPPLVTPQREIVATGTPLPGNQAAILGEDLGFLPAGEPGELALAGLQLAAGYFQQDELTRARFPTLAGQRWYRTGDLAVQDASGIFHHLGRIDNQVKVLGHRVELEEVETHLRAVSGCELVAAVAWPVEHGSAGGVVGFVCGSEIPAASLREALKQRLPTYMVPTAIHMLESLPLNPHGKLNRKALAALLNSRGSGQSGPG